MKLSKSADRVFLLAILALIIFGLAALASASSPAGYAKFGDPYFFVKKQIYFGLIPGLFLFFLIAHLDYRIWKKLCWVVYFLSIVSLALVFVPGVGLMINGSRSWIEIFGYSFQPAELAKLAVALVSAKWLADAGDLKDLKREILPFFAILSPIILLVLLQPDIGTLSILLVIIFFQLFLTSMPRLYLVILALLGAVAFAVLMLVMPQKIQRLTTFLYPELDPKGVGYQINQAYLAVGSGGFWGLGFNNSRQKFQYLPEVQSDSIFAIIAEETGFLFSSLLILLIAFISIRGFKTAKEVPDEFGSLLSAGVMVWFLWQSLLNISSVIGLLPLTGVPLPFISQGGSAYLSMLAALAMVANASKSK